MMNKLILIFVGIIIWLPVAPAEFQSAQEPYTWNFPKSHGAHETFQTEWWYVTGHLRSDQKDLLENPSEYGFQLTFFRRRDSSGSKATHYLAHAALSVLNANTPHFLFEHRFAPAGIPLAEASPVDLSVSHGDWLLERIGDEAIVRFSVENKNLSLRFPLNPLWLQGKDGLSKKGSGGGASRYYSIPSVQTQGTLRDETNVQEVYGRVWLDHEFMSNALEPQQRGWDWFSLTLAENKRAVVFRLRDNAGKADYFHAALWDNGKIKELSEQEVALQNTKTWKSPCSGAEYPVAWKLMIAGQALELESLLENQEHCSLTNKKAPQYYEGAIRDKKSSAFGYAELTGYAENSRPDL